MKTLNIFFGVLISAAFLTALAFVIYFGFSIGVICGIVFCVVVALLIFLAGYKIYHMYKTHKRLSLKYQNKSDEEEESKDK
jgi:predicted RND superfamily exporter protein